MQCKEKPSLKKPTASIMARYALNIRFQVPGEEFKSHQVLQKHQRRKLWCVQGQNTQSEQNEMTPCATCRGVFMHCDSSL